MSIDLTTKTHLKNYVTEQVSSNDNKLSILNFCKQQRPASLTVYRGHKNSQNIRNDNWYSATKNLNVASKEFAGDDCCLFIIHLVNVPIIDVNFFIKDDIGQYAEEEEVIFLGNGKFFKNDKMTEEGVLELGNKKPYNKLAFETWYSLTDDKKIKKNVIDEQKIQSALNILDEDDYEFIDKPEDIFIDRLELTHYEKQEIYNRIFNKGGRKKPIKKTKTKKRKTAAHKNVKKTRKTTKRFNKKNSNRRKRF
jgi:hypothetical protein